jgi:hypothetical protein
MTQPGRPPGSSTGTQTGKAVLLIAVVVLVGFLVLKHNPKSTTTTTPTTHSSSHTTSTLSSRTTPTTAPVLVPAASIKLQVLNGVGTGTYAGQWSTKLKANPGYNTLAPDDATAKVAASMIYVLTPGYLPEANALAAAVGLQASAVNPTIPAPLSAPIRASERTIANLVLVIGPDLAGRA